MIKNDHAPKENLIQQIMNKCMIDFSKKYVLVILICHACFSSCSGQAVSKGKDNYSHNNLIGWWTLAANEVDSINSNCNVCPKIYFDNGNIGRILTPQKEYIYFDFFVDENKIFFKMNRNRDYFMDTLGYYYKITSTKRDFRLNLQSMDKRKVYWLVR
jgi:hypothetical protein